MSISIAFRVFGAPSPKTKDAMDMDINLARSRGRRREDHPGDRRAGTEERGPGGSPPLPLPPVFRGREAPLTAIAPPSTRGGPGSKGSGEGAKLFALRGSRSSFLVLLVLFSPGGRRESAKLFALRASRSAKREPRSP